MRMRDIVYPIFSIFLVSAISFAAQGQFNAYEEYGPYQDWKDGKLEYRGEKGPHVLLRSMLASNFETENARFQHGDTHLTITLQADGKNFIPGEMANLIIKNSQNPARTVRFREAFDEKGYATFEIPYGEEQGQISSGFEAPVNVTTAQSKSELKRLGAALPLVVAYLLPDHGTHRGILGNAESNTMMAIQRDFGVLATAFNTGGEVAAALEKYALPAGMNPAVSHGLSAGLMLLASEGFEMAGKALAGTVLPEGFGIVGNIFFGAAFTNEVGVALTLGTEETLVDGRDREDIAWMAPLGGATLMAAGLIGYVGTHVPSLAKRMEGQYGKGTGLSDSFAITAVYLVRGSVKGYMAKYFPDSAISQELATGGFMLLTGGAAYAGMIKMSGATISAGQQALVGRHYADVVASNMIESAAVSAGFALGHKIKEYVTGEDNTSPSMVEYVTTGLISIPLFKYVRTNPNDENPHPGLRKGVAYNLRNGLIILSAFAGGGVLSGLWENFVDALGFKGEHEVVVEVN